jgi:hypothetical protein
MRVTTILLPLLLGSSTAAAFAPQSKGSKTVACAKSSTTTTKTWHDHAKSTHLFHHDDDAFTQQSETFTQTTSRRNLFEKTMSLLPIVAALGTSSLPSVSQAVSGAADFSMTNNPPEFVQQYSDFVKTEEGWQYKDIKVGTGDVVLQPGDRAVFEWSGYTIGYYGRPFEAKGGPVGGTFLKCLMFLL